MDQIVHDLSTVNDDEHELLKHIDEEILENEMKRRAIFDFEFEKSIEAFEESGVPDLLRCLFDENPEIAEKYPFLYGLSTILNDYLLTSKNYKNLSNIQNCRQFNNNIYLKLMEVM